MLIPIISLLFLHLASSAVLPYIPPSAVAEIKTAGLAIDIIQAPFNVAILTVIDMITRHHCGGVILRPDTVVTSGFCIYYSLPTGEYPHRVLVKAGTTFYGFGGQQVWVKDMTLHPDFNHESYKSNIGFLTLERDITMGLTASPIALPSDGTSESVTSAELTGWSKTSAGGKSENLQKFTIPLLDEDDCKVLHPTDVICAAAAEELPGDPCYGDVGNPLVVNGVLLGITLWSFDCGTPFSPWIFTSVAPYADWLSTEVTTTEGTTVELTTSEDTTIEYTTIEYPTTDYRN